MWHECGTWLNAAMTHSYVPWLIHVCHDSFICAMTHSYVTWLIHMWHISSHLMLCNLTQFFMWHDSILCDMTQFLMWHGRVTSRNAVFVSICDMIRTCDRTDVCDMTHMCYTYVIHVWCHLFAVYVYICDTTHVWHDSSAWHNSYVWHDSCVWYDAYVFHICHTFVISLNAVWYDSIIHIWRDLFKWLSCHTNEYVVSPINDTHMHEYMYVCVCVCVCV